MRFTLPTSLAGMHTSMPSEAVLNVNNNEETGGSIERPSISNGFHHRLLGISHLNDVSNLSPLPMSMSPAPTSYSYMNQASIDFRQVCAEIAVFVVGEASSFTTKAVESLVKRLKRDPVQIDNLLHALRTKSKDTPCATFGRTKDGRMQIGMQKFFPPETFYRLFRDQAMRTGDLAALPDCLHGNTEHSNLVCVNPFHYRHSPLETSRVARFTRKRSQTAGNGMAGWIPPPPPQPIPRLDGWHMAYFQMQQQMMYGANPAYYGSPMMASPAPSSPYYGSPMVTSPSPLPGYQNPYSVPMFTSSMMPNMNMPQHYPPYIPPIVHRLTPEIVQVRTQSSGSDQLAVQEVISESVQSGKQAEAVGDEKSKKEEEQEKPEEGEKPIKQEEQEEAKEDEKPDSSDKNTDCQEEHVPQKNNQDPED